MNISAGAAWTQMSPEAALCYSLHTRASSILARTTHIPHMIRALCVAD